MDTPNLKVTGNLLVRCSSVYMTAQNSNLLVELGPAIAKNFLAHSSSS